jgi:hypothetical protein
MTGSRQNTPTAPGSARRTGCGTRPARGQSRSSLLLLGLCATAVLAVLTGGCSNQAPAALSPARKATGPSAADVQRLKQAKAEAAAVLADVEVCEAEVMAGPELDDLTAKSALAHASVEAFTRTQSSKLLPKFTAAIALADKAYADCCVVWRADERAAQALWGRAGTTTGKKSVDECRHPERYSVLWVKGGLDLGKARQGLRDDAL